MIAALLVLALSRCMSAGTQVLSSAYLPYTAAMHDMTVAVSGTGTIEPIQSYKVTTLVSGEILEAPFEEGQDRPQGRRALPHRRQRRGEQHRAAPAQRPVPPQLALNDLLEDPERQSERTAM